jgi:hypothetical protein
MQMIHVKSDRREKELFSLKCKKNIFRFYRFFVILQNYFALIVKS